jgi:hypothetical protein
MVGIGIMVWEGVEVTVSVGYGDGVAGIVKAVVGDNAAGVTWETGWHAARDQLEIRSNIKP